MTSKNLLILSPLLVAGLFITFQLREGMIMNRNILAITFIGWWPSLYAMDSASAIRLQKEEVTLVDAQSVIHHLSTEAAKHAYFIKNVVEANPENHLAENSEWAESLPLPNIKSEAMCRLKTALELLALQRKEELDNLLQELSLPLLIEDANVADYVEAPELLDMIAPYLASRIIAVAVAHVENMNSVKRLYYKARKINPFFKVVIPYIEMINSMDIRAFVREECIDYLKRTSPWLPESTQQGYQGGDLLAYSADGTQLITGISKTIAYVRDAKTFRIIKEFHNLGGTIASGAFSHDGKKIALGLDRGTLHLWNIDTGEWAGTLHNGIHCSCLAWSPDNTKIATGSLNAIHIWDATTLQSIGRPMRGDIALINSVAWSPDGKMIAAGLFNGIVGIWNAHTQELIKLFAGDTVGHHVVVFSPDSKILFTASRGGVRVWDTKTSQFLGSPEVNSTVGFKSIEFSSDSTRLILRSVSDGIAHILHQPAVKDFIDHSPEDK